MKKGPIVTGLILLTTLSRVFADEATPRYSDETMNYDLYRAHEFNLDVFGTDTLGQHTINHPSTDRIRNNSVLGAGIGASYFICRYVGVGADAYTENTAHNFVDNVSGNLIGRFPIGNTGLAPYAYGGGGYKFDPVSTWFGQVGGGLEYRFTHNVGIFVDARYVIADRIRNYGVGRAGIRFAL